jgi:hypothetical protein
MLAHQLTELAAYVGAINAIIVAQDEPEISAAVAETPPRRARISRGVRLRQKTGAGQELIAGRALSDPLKGTAPQSAMTTLSPLKG